MNPLTELEIQSRIESSKQTQTLEIDGVKMRYAFMSQRGYYPEGIWLSICYFHHYIERCSLYSCTINSFREGQSRRLRSDSSFWGR